MSTILMDRFILTYVSIILDCSHYMNDIVYRQGKENKMSEQKENKLNNDPMALMDETSEMKLTDNMKNFSAVMQAMQETFAKMDNDPEMQRLRAIMNS